MKLTAYLSCFFTLLNFTTHAQITEELKYCNCTDEIESISPYPNGTYQRTCARKVIETGTFKDGRKDGLWTTYSKSGKVIRKIEYKNDSINGNVELFYSTGKPKLTGSFINNQRTGTWTYYTSKGKVRITGEYAFNKPVNTWIIKDFEGKNTLVQYDFNTSAYTENKSVIYHKDWDVIQNDNTGEFFILLVPERSNYQGTAPLGGYNFANDLFIELMEIPIGFWDTYVHKNYVAQFSISKDNASVVEVAEGDYSENNPQLTFITKTNDTDKLKRVEFSDLSNLLLLSKINETLLFMPPWVYEDKSEVTVQIPYVINDIEGIEIIEK